MRVREWYTSKSSQNPKEVTDIQLPQPQHPNSYSTADLLHEAWPGSDRGVHDIRGGTESMLRVHDVDDVQKPPAS